MIGAHFKPAGLSALVSFPANELRDQVVHLDSVWGHCTDVLREQLLAAAGARARFGILEAFLLDRLAKSQGGPDGRERVMWAVKRFFEQPHLLTIRAVASLPGRA